MQQSSAPTATILCAGRMPIHLSTCTTMNVVLSASAPGMVRSPAGMHSADVVQAAVQSNQACRAAVMVQPAAGTCTMQDQQPALKDS